MPADRKLTRRLLRFGDFPGQPDLRFKPLMIAIDEGYKRNRHLKNAPCRLVVGLASLPLGAPVELEIIFEVTK